MSAADWQLARLASDATPIEEGAPPLREEVLAWVSDEAVSIYYCPIVAWRCSDGWWAGLPGSYIHLDSKRWTVTHWRPIRACDSGSGSKSGDPLGAPAEGQQSGAPKSAHRPNPGAHQEEVAGV